MAWMWVVLVWCTLAVCVSLLVVRGIRLADRIEAEDTLEPNFVVDADHPAASPPSRHRSA